MIVIELKDLQKYIAYYFYEMWDQTLTDKDSVALFEKYYRESKSGFEYLGLYYNKKTKKLKILDKNLLFTGLINDYMITLERNNNKTFENFKNNFPKSVKRSIGVIKLFDYHVKTGAIKLDNEEAYERYGNNVFIIIVILENYLDKKRINYKK